MLFGLIPLLNKERVPYTAGDKISFKDMMGALKSNKPFMLVIISYFLGFGRQMAMEFRFRRRIFFSAHRTSSQSSASRPLLAR